MRSCGYTNLASLKGKLKVALLDLRQTSNLEAFMASDSHFWVDEETGSGFPLASGICDESNPWAPDLYLVFAFIVFCCEECVGFECIIFLLFSCKKGGLIILQKCA